MNTTSKKYLVVGGAVALGLALLIARRTEPRVAQADVPVAPEVEESIELPGSRTFMEWMAAPAAMDLDEGIALAKERGQHMRELMRSEPEQAIREALTLAEWAGLPDEIKAHVEEPFSAMANVEVLIACGGETSETTITTELPTLGKTETTVYGRRSGLGTKNGTPVQGIRLGGLSVLREEIFQSLGAADEAAALKLFPVAVSDPGGDSVVALAGGKIFYFKNRAALDEANSRLAALEELPGPDSGAQSIFQALDEMVLDGEIDFQALEELANAAATAWTGTPRNMYVIQVDFPDKPGAPTDPVAFSNLVNTTVSQQIWDMSYEKTHIICTVNTNTYRMSLASTNATYNSGAIYDEATAMAEADGIDLSPYQTICINHKGVGGYAGLASLGGKKMWLRSYGAQVVVHELGHNYGAHHAAAWTVTNSPAINPVDPIGEASEYGDFTDIMGGGKVPAGHFNAWHKKKVRWFDAENWLSVTHSGTYRVYRSDDRETTGLLRGLEIDKGDGGDYWVGLRQEYNEYERFGRGAYIIWKKKSDKRSYLIDMTPQSDDEKYDSGLALGQTYSDAAAGVHITPVARGGQTHDEWLDFAVNLGDFPGNHPPTASLNVPAGLGVRSSALFSVTASDVDGDELSYFWDIGDGLVKANSSSVAVSWAAGGSVSVSCTVSDMKGGTNTVSYTTVLADPFEDWTQHTSGSTTESINDAVVHGGKILAVGGAGGVYTSTNGVDWSHSDLGGNKKMFGIVHDGTQYIGAGVDYDWGGPGWESAIYTSPGGTNWTKRFDGGSLGLPKLYDVAIGGGVIVAVGGAGSMVRSTDGINWSPVASGTTTKLQGISYGDGVFVAVGDGAATVVLTSPDGLSWTDHSAGVDMLRWKGFDDVQYCNDHFLASGWYARIMSSTDLGQTFSTVMTGDRQVIPAFAYGNGIYFAAGVNKDDGDADINLISLDGEHWTELATPNQDNRLASVFFENTFITFGEKGSIWQSGQMAPQEDGFAVWQLENEAVLGMNRDPLEDADFDGSENLLEYALGSSATDPSSLPAYASEADPAGYFQLSVERDGIKGDIDYVVERTTNLVSNDWNAAETVTVIDSATNLTVRSAIPIDEQDQEFLQLKIDLK